MLKIGLRYVAIFLPTLFISVLIAFTVKDMMAARGTGLAAFGFASISGAVLTGYSIGRRKGGFPADAPVWRTSLLASVLSLIALLAVAYLLTSSDGIGATEADAGISISPELAVIAAIFVAVSTIIVRFGLIVGAAFGLRRAAYWSYALPAERDVMIHSQGTWHPAQPRQPPPPGVMWILLRLFLFTLLGSGLVVAIQIAVDPSGQGSVPLLDKLSIPLGFAVAYLTGDRYGARARAPMPAGKAWSAAALFLTLQMGVGVYVVYLNRPEIFHGPKNGDVVGFALFVLALVGGVQFLLILTTQSMLRRGARQSARMG